MNQVINQMGQQMNMEQRVEKLEKEVTEMRRLLHGDMVTGARPLHVVLGDVARRLGRVELAQYVMAAALVTALVVFVVSS